MTDANGDVIKVGSYAKPDEPLIPAFPMGSDCNHFLGAVSAGRATLAKTENIKFTPEKMTQALIDMYPGLPAKYLEEIVIRLTVSLYTNKTRMKGKVFRCQVSGHDARLQDIKNPDELIPLWSDLNPATYLS